MMDLDFFTLDDFDFSGATVLLRVDVNSPLDPFTGRILDDSRFRAHLRTILELRNSKLVILAHQSRPGKRDFTPLREHARLFSILLRKRVKFVDGLIESFVQAEIERARPGDILVLQNTRFYSEEVVLSGRPRKELEATYLVKRLSEMGDFFVNDAFAAAHRSQATLVGLAELMPMIAGRLMERELKALGRVQSVREPRIAILGGAKVRDSLKAAKGLLDRGSVQKVVLGGLVANVALMAGGHRLGEASERILEKELEDLDGCLRLAEELLERHGEDVVLPEDLAVDLGGRREMGLDDLPAPGPIMDLGSRSIRRIKELVSGAGGIILNGPLGVFEREEFSKATKEVFYAIANSDAFVVAGGGHTIAALRLFGLERYIDHISTGGGSLMAYLAGEELPVIEALRASKRRFESPFFPRE